MIAQHVAVVRRETEDRVVQQPLLAQHADQHAQLMIDVCAKSIEGAARQLRLDFVVLARPDGNPRAANRAAIPHPPSIRRRTDRRSPPCHTGRDTSASGTSGGCGWRKERYQKPGRNGSRRLMARHIWSTAQLVACRCSGRCHGPRRVIVVAHSVAEVLPGVSVVAQEQLVVVLHAILHTALFVQQHIIEAYPIALRDRRAACPLRMLGSPRRETSAPWSAGPASARSL